MFYKLYHIVRRGNSRRQCKFRQLATEDQVRTSTPHQHRHPKESPPTRPEELSDRGVGRLQLFLTKKDKPHFGFI